ncbi:uncharacterized protein EV420DRAFT_1481016 [Desarmillaria tabescens]|uniref:Uncharacterized protein n=1 Tax=Armillaria tabescens TaxID=1929756 RepID=A0AA39KC63_ARMTA|nr:uncharacterized protein EV420DRAFT_1481016 [Desarmillaria tabescens]KAK0457151.1 hypothetical protein EV420DRAFT_1481016 [Desarmillaria tabescens]
MSSSEYPDQDPPRTWIGPEPVGPFVRRWHNVQTDDPIPNLPTSMTPEEPAESTDVPESKKEHLDPAYMFCWRKLMADEEMLKHCSLPIMSLAILLKTTEFAEGRFTYTLDNYFEDRLVHIDRVEDGGDSGMPAKELILERKEKYPRGIGAPGTHFRDDEIIVRVVQQSGSTMLGKEVAGTLQAPFNLSPPSPTSHRLRRTTIRTCRLSFNFAYLDLEGFQRSIPKGARQVKNVCGTDLRRQDRYMQRWWASDERKLLPGLQDYSGGLPFVENQVPGPLTRRAAGKGVTRCAKAATRERTNGRQ